MLILNSINILCKHMAKKVQAKNFILIGILCDGIRWLATILISELFWIFFFKCFTGLLS